MNFICIAEAVGITCVTVFALGVLYTIVMIFRS